MYQDSGFREPSNEGNQRDQQRRAGRERSKARRITAGNLAKRRADNKRNGGSNRDGGVARPAKDPEDKSSEQTGIKTRFRPQVRKRRVAHRRGKQICGERNSSENIAAQPTPIISA